MSLNAVNAAIDLSDLQQLTALFNTLLQAFLPIILIIAFIGFVVLLVGGKAFLGKIANMAYPTSPSLEKLHRKVKHKNALRTAIIGLMFLSILAFSSIPASGSTSAAGVGGTIDVGTTQIFANTPITVTASELDASGDYAIIYDGTAKFNWTAAAVPKDMIITFTALAPSTGDAVDILLMDGAAVVLVTLTLFVATASGFLPTSFLIELGVALIVIGVVALVVIAIVRKRG